MVERIEIGIGMGLGWWVGIGVDWLEDYGGSNFLLRGEGEGY